MIRGLYAAFVLISPLFLPALAVGLFAVCGAVVLPILPVAAGAMIDIFYFTHGIGGFPIYTVIGAVISAAAFLLRFFLETRYLR